MEIKRQRLSSGYDYPIRHRLNAVADEADEAKSTLHEVMSTTSSISNKLDDLGDAHRLAICCHDLYRPLGDPVG